MELIYTEPTPGDRDRLYARIETVTDAASGSLSNVRFGTVSRSRVDLDPVREGESESGRVGLDEIEDYYAAQLRDDFEERPLEGFVAEFTERTPYTRAQAELVVTRGWFKLSRAESIRAINQHLREPYEELSEAAFEETLEAVADTRRRIENANRYPYCL